MQTRPLRKPVQLVLPSWGGKRKGAGRKPLVPGKPGVPHVPRPLFSRATAFHVTLKMDKHVYNLRSRRCFRVVEKALGKGASRFGARVVEISVQGNHIHLLVEAKETKGFCRAMKGLSVRLAKGLNKVMQGRKGRVIADRYHAHWLRTPSEARNALSCVRSNHRKHLAALGQYLPATDIDTYSSASPKVAQLLPKASTWLLTQGIHRAKEDAVWQT